MAENGSIDGGMTTSRSPVHPVGRVLRAVRTRRRRRVRCRACRNAQAASVSSLRVSRPTWQRHTTRTPRRAEAVDHAGGLRVVQQHDVAGADQGEHLGDVGVDDPLVAGALVRSPRGPPSPGSPCRRLCRRFVMAKNSGSPSRTSHRFSICAPSPVRQQRLEHLGDAATVGRGVDVPDRAVPERQPGLAPPQSARRRARSGVRMLASSSSGSALTSTSCIRTSFPRVAGAPDKPPPHVRHALSVRELREMVPCGRRNQSAAAGAPPTVQRTTASASDCSLQR